MIVHESQGQPEYDIMLGLSFERANPHSTCPVSVTGYFLTLDRCSSLNLSGNHMRST